MDKLKLIKDIIIKSTEKPVKSYFDSNLSVHTLLCSKHVPFYLYSIKTFLEFSGLRCRVFVYDDGTLTEDDQALIKKAVKNVKIMSLKDNKIPNKLNRHPNCLNFFKKNIFGKRLFGIYFSAKTDKIIILDSDVLFFKKPKEIINWAKSKKRYTLFNKDLGKDGSIIFNKEDFKRFGIKKIDYFNAGLVCTHRSFIDLGSAERIIEYMHKYKKDALYWKWTSEQTALAVLISRFENKALPDTYFFCADDISGRNIQDFVSKHYSQFARNYFFTEGVRYLIESNKI
ncbi:hypothetical protein KY361_06535 [Candidatus Woesearchaeota archaeon]|nr:hypothetical protein [Candidatus Woesearchaeota archaeon]